MRYTVYFEMFDKRMKTTVEADNEEQAKYMVLGRVKFHRVELAERKMNGKDMFNEIFGI